MSTPSTQHVPEELAFRHLPKQSHLVCKGERCHASHALGRTRFRCPTDYDERKADSTPVHIPRALVTNSSLRKRSWNQPTCAPWALVSPRHADTVVIRTSLHFRHGPTINSARNPRQPLPTGGPTHSRPGRDSSEPSHANRSSSDGSDPHRLPEESSGTANTQEVEDSPRPWKPEGTSWCFSRLLPSSLPFWGTGQCSRRDFLGVVRKPAVKKARNTFPLCPSSHPLESQTMPTSREKRKYPDSKPNSRTAGFHEHCHRSSNGHR